MRAKLANRVRRRFSKRLLAELPEFVELEGEGVSHPKGNKLFAWRCPSATFFIHLNLAAKGDQFTLEVAWSRTHTYPPRTTFLKHGGRFGPFDYVSDGEMSFRVSLLCDGLSREGFWQVDERPDIPLGLSAEGYMEFWQKRLNRPKPEELYERADALVDQAITCVHEHVVPYFKEVSARIDLVTK